MQWIEKLKRMQFRWVALIAAVVLLLTLFAYGLWRNDRDLRQAMDEEEARQIQLTSLQAELDSLKVRYREVDTSDSSYIESRARAELGYLKPGEIRFQVTNPDLLDSYTDEEWQIRLAEMAFDE